MSRFREVVGAVKAVKREGWESCGAGAGGANARGVKGLAVGLRGRWGAGVGGCGGAGRGRYTEKGWAGVTRHLPSFSAVYRWPGRDWA